MKLSRRGLLEGAGALSLAAAAPGCGGEDEALPPADDLAVYEYEGPLGPEALFSHGVASGDPDARGFVIWTRVSPVDGAPVEVWYEVAKDRGFRQRVLVGSRSTSEAADFTFKLVAEGLESGRQYFYRFKALGRTSPVGRAKTAPTADVSRLRFAVVSCSNFAYGYFHVYRHVAAREDIDAVLHLGDYIYEYGEGQYGSARPCEPEREILTLDDYRTRYAQYRRDPDLQAAHAAHAFITVWDDHETADNSYKDGAGNHDPATEGEWSARMAAAKQAYFEWMPLRVGASGSIHRALSYGPLCELFMLDTRLEGREEPVEGGPIATVEETLTADRDLLGPAQERWLLEALSASGARWKLLGQQVMMAQLKLNALPNAQGGGTVFNVDQWDGFPSSRRRLLEHVVTEDIGGLVVLTGDIHTSWASDVCLDPNEPSVYDPATGRGAICVEFVTPAITSPGLAGLSTAVADVVAKNVHIKYCDVERRGWVLLTLTAAACQADWYHVEQVDEPELSPQRFSAGYLVRAGTRHLAPATKPA